MAIFSAKPPWPDPPKTSSPTFHLVYISATALTTASDFAAGEKMEILVGIGTFLRS